MFIKNTKDQGLIRINQKKDITLLFSALPTASDKAVLSSIQLITIAFICFYSKLSLSSKKNSFIKRYSVYYIVPLSEIRATGIHCLLPGLIKAFDVSCLKYYSTLSFAIIKRREYSCLAGTYDAKYKIWKRYEYKY